MTTGTDDDGWRVVEDRLDVDRLDRTGALFALANGRLGVRGTLDEGDPAGLAGSYLAGVHDSVPIDYAEPAYGYPASAQRIAAVQDGTPIRLRVDGSPLDVRAGPGPHRRTLDLRTGTLDRESAWPSVRVTSRRLVSLRHPALLAVRYEVEALEGAPVVEVESDLTAGGLLPAGSGRGHLLGRTRGSDLRVAAAVDTRVTLDGRPVETATTASPVLVRTTAAVRLRPGRRLRVDKLVAYAWDEGDPLPAATGALAEGLRAGWDGLLADQRAELDAFWAAADVRVGGDAELQRAIRFALFHVLQAAACAGGQPIPAKGLTGPGYDGQSFWDTEVYVLPVLVHSRPDAARDVLRWRHGCLPRAEARARELGLDGAAFPWRTIDGTESSGYWPASTAAFHVNAGIAMAVLRYVEATGDTGFEREAGVDLLVATARLWLSLGRTDLDGSFHLDGVTGPDEYGALRDDNVYTNLMAQGNLRAAADAAERHGADVDPDEIAAWRAAADAMAVPYDEELGIHEQSAGYPRLARWDFAATKAEDYPLFEHAPYVQLYRKQVIKQADLVLAMLTRGDAFTPEQKRRNVDYYEPLIVRDSSLSAGVQAVLAAEVGHRELAYRYACEAALADLHDLRGGTAEGLHVASLAAAWFALVCGFGGLRDCSGSLEFVPRLPPGLDLLAFRVRRGPSVLAVEVRPDAATYELVSGPPVRLGHHGEQLEVRDRVTRPIADVPIPPCPAQPPTREPLRPG